MAARNLSRRDKQALHLAVLQAGDMIVEGQAGDEHLTGLMGLYELRPESWKCERPVYQFCGLQRRDIFLYFAADRKKWVIAEGDTLRTDAAVAYVSMRQRDNALEVTPDKLIQGGACWKVAPGDGQWYNAPGLRIRRVGTGEKDKYMAQKREEKRAALEQARKIGDIELEGKLHWHSEALGTYKLVSPECVNERPVYMRKLRGKTYYLYLDELGMWRVQDNPDCMRRGKPEGKLCVESRAITPNEIGREDHAVWRQFNSESSCWEAAPTLNVRPYSPDAMNVAELKRFITDAGGSHANCVEKSELKKLAWDLVNKSSTSNTNGNKNKKAVPSESPLSDQTSGHLNAAAAPSGEAVKSTRLSRMSEAELYSAGVKQLKELLSEAGISHVDCVEKSDLQKKALGEVRKNALCQRLVLFYRKHNPEKAFEAATIVEQVKGDEAMLNGLLRNAYKGQDLSGIQLTQSAVGGSKAKDEAAAAAAAAAGGDTRSAGGGSIHNSLKENSVDEGSSSSIPTVPAPVPAVASEVVERTTVRAPSSPQQQPQQQPPPPPPPPVAAEQLSPTELLRNWLLELGLPADKASEYAETLHAQGFEEPAELVDAELDAAELSGEPFKFMYKFSRAVAKECANPQLASSAAGARPTASAGAGAGAGAGSGQSGSAEVEQLKRRLQEAEAAAKALAQQQQLVQQQAPPTPPGKPSSRGAGKEWVLAGWEVPAAEIKQIRSIGRGSFGEVKLVRVRGVHMAAKCITSVTGGGQEAQDKAVALLLKELRPMAELLHKHIVRLWGACTAPGDLCILMEYMERGSLRQVLDAHPQLPPATRFRLLHGVVLGMTHAHAHRPCPVLHRDLKSANVLVGSDWRSVVGDLGLATGAGSTLSRTNTSARGGVAGTLAYSAPEVLNDKSWALAGDVYSFGVLAYETITGKVPFNGHTVVELVMDVVAKALRCHGRGYAEALAPHDLLPEVPGYAPEGQGDGTLRGCNAVLTEAMVRAWSQDPKQRPSFEGLRALFERAEDGEGGQAYAECAAELQTSGAAAGGGVGGVPTTSSVVTAPAVPAPAAPAAEPANDGRFAPYQKMRKMRLPDGAIRQKMMTNGESDADIAAFFGEAPATARAAPAPTAPAVAAPVAPAASGKFAPFEKLRKMGLPDAGVRQKMAMAGFSDDEINGFLGGGGGGGVGRGGLPPAPRAQARAAPVAAAAPARPAGGGMGGMLAEIQARNGGGLRKAKPVERKKASVGSGGGGGGMMGMMAQIQSGVKLKKASSSDRPPPKSGGGGAGGGGGGGGFAAELQNAIKRPQLRKRSNTGPPKATAATERRGSGGGGLFSNEVMQRIDMQRRAIHDTRDDIHETQDPSEWD